MTAVAAAAGISRKQQQLIESNHNVSMETLLKVVAVLEMESISAGAFRITRSAEIDLDAAARAMGALQRELSALQSALRVGQDVQPARRPSSRTAAAARDVREQMSQLVEYVVARPDSSRQVLVENIRRLLADESPLPEALLPPDQYGKGRRAGRDTVKPPPIVATIETRSEHQNSGSKRKRRG